MRYFESERRGWTLVSIFLLSGLACVLLAGNLAIRLSPSWRLPADMRSALDPEAAGDFLPPLPNAPISPLDPSILTPPIWIDAFLTPGATFPTRLPQATATPSNDSAPSQNVPTITAPVSPSPTGTFVSFPATQTWVPAATSTSEPEAPTAKPTLQPSEEPPPVADLQITKSNGVLVYSAGSTLTYTITVTNSGPGNASGAVITDAFPPQFSSWSWACASLTNGASGCDPAGDGAAGFSDTVDLSSGASITYLVTANIRGNANSDLVNTAAVAVPADVSDPVPGNNSAVDLDNLLRSFPYRSISTEQDGMISVVLPGTSVALAFDQPLLVGGHPGWDLILYELPNGSGVAMDLVILEIGDGTRWYTIFNWGDNLPDTNTNMDISVLGGQETDNRDFTTSPNSDILYPFGTGTPENPATGIVIELDGVVPPGTYPYIRISSPAGGAAGSDMDGGCEIDAIVIVP